MTRERRFLQGLWMAAAVLLGTAGCVEDEGGGVSVTSGSTTELYSVVNQSGYVSFNAADSWKARCSANWLTFSPTSGDKGGNVITVSTTGTNRTGNVRTAQLIIESGGKSQSITIRQRDEYAMFSGDELNLPYYGATVGVSFRTNVEQDKLHVYATNGLEEWIKTTEADSRTRAEYEGNIYPLRALPNESLNARDGALFLMMEDANGELLGLDTLFVYQDGRQTGYRSGDFSADGKVELLNRATEGKGIPIVLMGDGFQDEEIASGYYGEAMNQAMENIFSEEPIRSLRDYFNVYQVTAVSYDHIGGPETAIGTYPDHQTMGISVDAGKVMNYVKKVENIDSIHALAVVILNSTINRGVTYMIGSNKQDYSYAIALCPTIDSLKSERFRQVLTHEAVGHGFAKLADEYVRSTEGSATDEDIKQLKNLHENYGWYLNVDSEKDTEKVLWTKFVSDSEFANEKIGAYEGAYTFYKGVYRPTEESMMRSNNAPFNAPSRQAIYGRVMKLGLDKTATYDEFVAFDREHKPTVWSYASRTRQSEGVPWRPAPPRVIWKNW